jgi:hypothetical protein
MSIIRSATVTCSSAVDGSPRPSSQAALRGQLTDPVVVRTAVVVEHRVNSLLPLAALIDQRMPQAHARAQVEDVLGRDPRLRQPVDHQQLAQMPGVRPIGLGALLSPPPRGGLRRLGQTHLGADSAQLLDHKAPARGRLQRHLEPVFAEAAKESPHAGSVGGPHPRPADLAGGRVDPLGRDLCPVLIEPHDDRHAPSPPCPSQSPSSSTTRAVTRAAFMGPTHRIPWVTVGTSSFEWPAARALSARALTYAVRRGGPATFKATLAPTCSCHRCGSERDVQRAPETTPFVDNQHSDGPLLLTVSGIEAYHVKRAGQSDWLVRRLGSAPRMGTTAATCASRRGRLFASDVTSIAPRTVSLRHGQAARTGRC